jgi:hypothetical protein
MSQDYPAIELPIATSAWANVRSLAHGFHCAYGRLSPLTALRSARSATGRIDLFSSPSANGRYLRTAVVHSPFATSAAVKQSADFVPARSTTGSLNHARTGQERGPRRWHGASAVRTSAETRPPQTKGALFSACGSEGPVFLALPCGECQRALSEGRATKLLVLRASSRHKHPERRRAP